jgi:hypothetical protein
VQAKPVALGVQQSAHRQLRCRVACPHPSHELTSLARIEDVSHVESYNNANQVSPFP